MARWTYDEALRRLLVHEGGYSNHPSDPGGPTNFGITIHDYRKYIDVSGSAADVRRMTVMQAKTIYKSKYWNAMRCDELPAGVDYAVFDYGVNSGIGRAPKVLKRVIGTDASSSTVTRQVIEAASRRNAKTLVNAICDERLRFLKSLRTWPVFGHGWGRRVAEVRAVSLAMIGRTTDDRGQATAGAKSNPSSVPGKGEVPINRPAQTGTAGGACAACGTCAAQAVDPVVIGAILVLTAVVAIGVWWFWCWWRNRQQTMPA